jgi:hypothetical protein
MSRLLRDLRLMPEVTACYAFGDVHHVTLRPDADISALRNRIKHADVSIRPVTPTVEDCFMALRHTPR